MPRSCTPPNIQTLSYHRHCHHPVCVRVSACLFPHQILSRPAERKWKGKLRTHGTFEHSSLAKRYGRSLSAYAHPPAKQTDRYQLRAVVLLYDSPQVYKVRTRYWGPSVRGTMLGRGRGAPQQIFFLVREVALPKHGFSSVTSRRRFQRVDPLDCNYCGLPLSTDPFLPIKHEGRDGEFETKMRATRAGGG